LGNATIGSGLAVGGDEVRLYTPAKVEVDAMSYGTDKNVFNPSVPVAPAGNSYYRTSLTTDSNTAADWGNHAPNPGT